MFRRKLNKLNMKSTQELINKFENHTGYLFDKFQCGYCHGASCKIFEQMAVLERYSKNWGESTVDAEKAIVCVKNFFFKYYEDKQSDFRIGFHLKTISKWIGKCAIAIVRLKNELKRKRFNQKKASINKANIIYLKAVMENEEVKSKKKKTNVDQPKSKKKKTNENKENENEDDTENEDEVENNDEDEEEDEELTEEDTEKNDVDVDDEIEHEVENKEDELKKKKSCF